MKKELKTLLLCGCAVLSITACNSETEETQPIPRETIRIETKETEIETEDPNRLKTGEMQSYLTGEPIDQMIGSKRPYAIMINNIEEGLPQSGISQAEIIYECPVEAGITRLMCEFQDLTHVNKIGSIRSARHYYMDLSMDDEAIYTHYGQSPFALDRIYEGFPTLRDIVDYSYRAEDRISPHDVFTTPEGLQRGLEAMGFSRDYPESYVSRLNFSDSPIEPENGETAFRVDIPFDYNQPWFEYDASDGLYYRYQYGGAHIDAENDEQLKFKNLIIQYADCYVISEQDHRDFDLYTTGTGLFISNGKAAPIQWERTSSEDRTRYYYDDGTDVFLNKGKTYIAVVPSELSVMYGAK